MESGEIDSMKILDITVTIHPDMPSYPGEFGPTLDVIKSIDRGDKANVSLMGLSTHTGTHVDAPIHFIPGGLSVDRIPPEALFGRVQVVEVDSDGHIGREELEKASLAPGLTRVLFKTRNGRLWEDASFREDFTAIAPDGARWLVQRGLLLVGIDYLSVEPFGAREPETHRILLGAGIAVVEGLDLRKIAPGYYTLVCLPLKIEGSDGSPARALLIEPPLPGLD